MAVWDYIKCYLGISPKKGSDYVDSINNNDIGTDYDNDDFIELTTAEGEVVRFVEIAGIKLKNGYYAILQPEKLLDGMGEDEALVFKVTDNGSGENSYEIELDDAIVDAVFEEYNRLLDEQEA